MITVRLQVKIGIDERMQRGQCGMVPQVLSTHLCTDFSASKTAEWMSEHWLDTTVECEGNTFSEAARSLVILLRGAPHLRWMYEMLSESDKSYGVR